jgi:hypothetical protein
VLSILKSQLVCLFQKVKVQARHTHSALSLSLQEKKRRMSFFKKIEKISQMIQCLPAQTMCHTLIKFLATKARSKFWDFKKLIFNLFSSKNIITISIGSFLIQKHPLITLKKIQLSKWNLQPSIKFFQHV